MTELTVYVPTDALQAFVGIAPGSAIVGSPEGERIRIDYEGDLYRRECMRGYATRLLHAAGRHVERYPTVARALVDPGDLRAIGEYVVEDERLTLDDEDLLCRWLGVTELAPEDRVAPTRRQQERAAIQQGLQGESRMSMALFAAQRGHEDLVPPELRHIVRVALRHGR